jgi:hypothetical protein
MVDGQQGNVSKHLKMKVKSNVHVVILQTLLSCLKSPMMSRFETIRTIVFHSNKNVLSVA